MNFYTSIKKAHEATNLSESEIRTWIEQGWIRATKLGLYRQSKMLISIDDISSTALDLLNGRQPKIKRKVLKNLDWKTLLVKIDSKKEKETR
jgi:hypothetical protein